MTVKRKQACIECGTLPCICQFLANRRKLGKRITKLEATRDDLLAACEAMLHAVETYGHFDKTDRMARAAIAKAKE